MTVIQLKPTVHFLFWYGMHSKNATILIDLLWFNVMHYCLFQYFFSWSTMVPTLVENS